ncbi:hypothetical protein LCM23_13220 [Cytobacillus kochii]|uniref:hypothetical protein n=1 Tax=Cytobacillus kochii TaxID=859143 RepID=UPI001CD6A23B|nr:hypothetical protein [Cytobacillus kochii]MCA1027056.1 hypothetical protein [Cytobacillus kochii]
MKIADWFREKVRKYLGITELEEKRQKDIIRNEQRFSTLFDRLNQLQEQNENIIKENNALMKQFNISADINHYENHSWAVISIQGRPEYVKFVNLSNQDMRSIHSYLKQFERTNRTMDSPLQFLKF